MQHIQEGGSCQQTACLRLRNVYMQPTGDTSETGASHTLSAERKNANICKVQIFGFTELLSTHAALRCETVKDNFQSHVCYKVKAAREENGFCFEKHMFLSSFCPSRAALSLLLLLFLLVLLKVSSC